jgi:hypothetical protein
MAKQSLDKLFQEKLKNHEIKPSNQAWEKLEFLLDGEDEAAPIPLIQRRKGVFWLSIAATLTLLVLSLAIWQMNRSGSSTVDIAKKNQKKSPQIETLDTEKNKAEYAEKQGEKSQNLSESADKSEQKLKSLEQNIDNKLPQVIDNQGFKNQVVKNKNLDKKNQQVPQNKPEKDLKKDQIIENQLLKKENLEDNIAKNDKNPTQENTTFKVVVTAKFNSTKAQSTPETAIADNSPKKKGVRGVIQSIREVKNGDKELKLFGMERDKLMASIGKGE